MPLDYKGKSCSLGVASHTAFGTSKDSSGKYQVGEFTSNDGDKNFGVDSELSVSATRNVGCPGRV